VLVDTAGADVQPRRVLDFGSELELAGRSLVLLQACGR
jgi:hypothetical protein